MSFKTIIGVVITTLPASLKPTTTTTTALCSCYGNNSSCGSWSFSRHHSVFDCSIYIPYMLCLIFCVEEQGTKLTTCCLLGRWNQSQQEMKCDVVENPAYDVVHVQASAGDGLEPDYNMEFLLLKSEAFLVAC